MIAQGIMRQHQAEQLLHYRSPRRKRMEKGAENIFTRRVAVNFFNLGKEINIRTKELRKSK